MPIGQLTVKDRMDKGKVGNLAGVGDHFIEENFPNAAPQQIQKDAIRVDTASANTTYSYVVDSETIQITTGSNPTTADVVNALVEEHNANPIVRGRAKASAFDPKVRIEGVTVGDSYDISTSDSNLTLNPASGDSQPAQVADPVDFGLAVFEGGAVVDASQLTAKSVQLTHAETASATLKLEIDGDLYEFSGSTASAVVTDINNNAPANTVSASEPSAGEVLIEAATAGDRFELVDADEGQFTLSSSTVGDRIEDEIGGITRSTSAEESGDKYHYPGNHGVIALQRGSIFVGTGDNASEGDAAYLQMTGSNAGKFYTSRGTGRVKVDPSVARWKESNVIQINLF